MVKNGLVTTNVAANFAPCTGTWKYVDLSSIRPNGTHTNRLFYWNAPGVSHIKYLSKIYWRVQDTVRSMIFWYNPWFLLRPRQFSVGLYIYMYIYIYHIYIIYLYSFSIIGQQSFVDRMDDVSWVSNYKNLWCILCDENLVQCRYILYDFGGYLNDTIWSNCLSKSSMTRNTLTTRYPTVAADGLASFGASSFPCTLMTRLGSHIYTDPPLERLMV